jgi:peptidoglycan hydrolase-like protein with peptidoglycan-binding domain
MNGITARKLSLDMRGKDVKLLENSLRKLGFDIPANEINDGIFGSKTEEAAKKLEEQHNLKPTEVVENQFAIRMKKLMRRSASNKQRQARYPSTPYAPAVP